MKLSVTKEGRRFVLRIPNCLLTNAHLIAIFYRITQKTSGKYAPEPMPDLSAAQLKPLCKELKRIKKCYGAYELVDVRSGQGDRVKIVL